MSNQQKLSLKEILKSILSYQMELSLMEVVISITNSSGILWPQLKKVAEQFLMKQVT